jgi:hypothetical protein
MGKTLSSVGGFLALAGVLSIVLYFIGWNLRILLWIDTWGSTMGWVIRIGITLVGVVLLVIGFFMGKEGEGGGSK